MSVEPVTVTITTEEHDGEIQHGLARAKAAVELGLEPNEILCLAVAPVGVQPATMISNEETGIMQVETPAKYTVESTWAPKHVDPERTHTPLPWPDVKLPRGAKWHGLVPRPGDEPVEALLISTGEKLVWPDSVEGQAVLADMGGDKPVTTILPANTFR